MSFEALFIKMSSIEATLFAFYLGFLIFFSTNFVLAISQKSNIIKTYKYGFKIILFCGILTGVSYLSFVSAIKTTSVANVVIIIALAPIFSALYSYLFYKIKVTKNIFIASFFIFIGLFIIFYEQLGKGQFLGNLYALITVNMFSLMYVLMSRYKTVNRFALISIGGLSVMLFSSILVDDFSINTHNLMIVLLVGIFVSPLSRVLIGMGTKSLPASEVGLLTLLETIFAPIWVWIFLNQIPPNTTFLGGSIILLTLIANSIYTIKAHRNFS